jgi:DnaJ-class molecular chaperone
MADALRQRIEQIHRDLEHYSYYQLLNLTAEAGPDDVRRAFHRMAISLHPDRYHSHSDATLRQQVYAIYKRITEGYRVLMDAELRREYDLLLAAGTKRLVKKERPQRGPKRPEAELENPQARKFFLLAQDAAGRGDKKGARMNYQFALNLEGDSPLIKQRLAALDD